MKFTEALPSSGYLKNSMGGGVNSNPKRKATTFSFSVLFNKLNMRENNVKMIFIYINMLYETVNTVGVVYRHLASYYNIAIIAKSYVTIIILKF